MLNSTLEEFGSFELKNLMSVAHRQRTVTCLIVAQVNRVSNSEWLFLPVSQKDLSDLKLVVCVPVDPTQGAACCCGYKMHLFLKAKGSMLGSHFITKHMSIVQNHIHYCVF